jgi:hypothetical protein
MKSLYFPLLVFGLLSLFSCEEISPVISPNMGEPVDTSINVDSQPRQVLIEEFTGVRCVNCPAGSAVVENLLNTHGDQLVAISIHAGGFSNPYPESAYDFRTTEGNNLLSFLGAPLGYPTAVVDRKVFDGEFDLQLFSNQWPGFISEQLLEPPKVRIGIEYDYNPGTRALDVTATIFVVETVDEEDIRISVAITENDVADMQLTPEGEDPDYKHKHILREMITAYDGNQLGEPLIAGGEIVREYATTLSEDYIANNCSVIVFVNLGGTSKEVLQVHEVKISE